MAPLMKTMKLMILSLTIHTLYTGTYFVFHTKSQNDYKIEPSKAAGKTKTEKRIKRAFKVGKRTGWHRAVPALTHRHSRKIYTHAATLTLIYVHPYIQHSHSCTNTIRLFYVSAFCRTLYFTAYNNGFTCHIVVRFAVG